ncbi:DUF3895 domain-containing protein [Bacillus cereus]|uniref:Uncharacterized protein n=1 Tax=Bacillus cereus 03BB108 TaxID=451709 RepID=A0AAN0SR82_BACCE|nr:DUF3895 domain-containing protein [Bacillus cereus]AJI08935.1 hypothetical protein AK40_5581 [Bacillus cereus 03BB108]EDX59923.1 hypothetical protein BC03BB108_B0227 [Bacillus cereus 03BB108]QKG99070.1 DUF3895 domain-containing protein [Bacillus cereus]
MDQLSLFEVGSNLESTNAAAPTSFENKKGIAIEYPQYLVDTRRTDERISGLTFVEMEGLNWYVENETEIRASEAAEYLITECKTPKISYSTDKLKIYPYVCMYLEYLRKKNIVVLIASRGTYERIYKNVKFC